MSAGCHSNKRRRLNIPEVITHTDSIGLCMDVAFLISYINSDDIFLWTLLSGQITNISFSELYDRSREEEWKQVLIDVRNNLKLDEKSKLKRIALNRLIEECSTNANVFNEKVKKLNEEMKRQTSDPTCICSQSRDNVYAYVNAWRQLQCERRLFYKECNLQCSLLTLQRLMTDHFIDLLNSFRQDPNFSKLGGPAALKKLFNHFLIIVVQPSGTDCVAVTKYEKCQKDFLTKIKTRIICLLDPDRVREYLEFSEVNVILYLKDRQKDPNGDVQSSLPWKTRTVRYNETETRTFWFVELNENDSMKLTKMKPNGKLLYNKELCQLKFQTKIKLIGTNVEESITINSQLFGLCSHSKFGPEYLTKVFIEELNQSYTEIDLTTHITILKGYINEFHKRLSGVEAKPHTLDFIGEELTNVYKSFSESASSPTGSVMFFNFDIYKDIFEKFITQMKYLGSHPFLSMMYYDSLFLAICDDKVDQNLNNDTLTIPHAVVRFAISKEQERPDKTNIIFVLYNGSFLRSRVTHGYLTTDMSTCICEAAENEGNQLQVFYDKKTIPFRNFRFYYDAELSRDNLIQTNNTIKYFPLRTLLRNPIQNNQVQTQTSNEQQIMTYTFNLSGQFSGNKDLTANAIVFLQEKYNQWCGMQNIQGSLSGYSINDEIGYDNFDDIFNENNS